ncbi:conserved Plasmodium protein, unknown function [Plasmodium berghei]|uniref:Glycoside hydrolase 35 catalytic domain-containing protein n=2 Tax=Plasmodium berghei TaxID=5821 RepID=A0A509AR29_PLABA|nr:conserved Plasmodium protein, unknown function [Plasmodium berghei ANKA]CXJ05659.1 conserved Plasmodium protein, unknown function [Plasmodium berghei]SCL98840.1 conserved Plasmodium protein, unknown function [Plasmodium berghei]SCM16913.1 conserved Plasmodium protein, unknown function [Plasmodium berghei]SCM18711.1 conserved Plasmodium protein, unknown function [Plasmodium berghei]SCN28147.1 conserved Plasmodium protein, unknown function [Plasmodium berghei]|eukprot:XP_034423796.1 conserved Plasmodium protein, unknown function [Plasmodium berghei ANKA]
MNLFFLKCFSFLFFLSLKIKCGCLCSTTKQNNHLQNFWKKFKDLFVDKETERNKNIITYNFIKNSRETSYKDIINNNEKTGYEVNHINRLIYINNFKTYILSAYIPYIHMSVRDIYIILKKIKELNFNTVYTFLFWPENEYLEDQYDTSNSKLFYLLNFCASNGLFVILDIGPYVDNVYNSNIPPYILFNKKINNYINKSYSENRNKGLHRFSPWNIWKRNKKQYEENYDDLNSLKKYDIDKIINKKKTAYNKNNNVENNYIYSLYYFQRVIKWFNYILPKLKKYVNINNGPIIYINIDKTFDNDYMYTIIYLKRKKKFQNICKIEDYFGNDKKKSATTFLSCVINFFKRIRRSYILTLGYLLYIRFNTYIKVIHAYESGLIYINEINKLVQKHLKKINILTTNYPYSKDEFINTYAGNNCYNHFLQNNWFDNECIKLNKPCIWSQVWTGAKYSIHNVSSPYILKKEFDDPILYEASEISSSNIEQIEKNAENSSIDGKTGFIKDHDSNTGNKIDKDKVSKLNAEYFGNNKNDESENGGKASNSSNEENDDEIYSDDEQTENESISDKSNESSKEKRIQHNYNSYIGYIRSYKDLMFNILIFLAKGGVFINIFPFYSGNNINNLYSYLEHYSKETGQPLDIYFNKKEPLYSHIKKLFKIISKYGQYLLKEDKFIHPVKISNNMEIYDYDVIKIICNNSIKGTNYFRLDHLSYNMNSFSCIIYNTNKKKIIYDSSYNYSYEYSYVKKKETYKPIDKYLYSIKSVNEGPSMCLKGDTINSKNDKKKKNTKEKNIYESKNKNLIPKSITKYINVLSRAFPNNHSQILYEINVLNHYYITLDLTKFQWYILVMKDNINYVKLFLSNHSLYIYIYADNKFIYGGFNEYKYVEIINAKNIYIICTNLGIGFPKKNIRTDFIENINLNDLRNHDYFENDNNDGENTQPKNYEQNSYINLNLHTHKKKKNNNEKDDMNESGEKSKFSDNKNKFSNNYYNNSNKEKGVNMGKGPNDGNSQNNKRKKKSIFVDFELDENDDSINSMYEENIKHNYYERESINTFIFIVTQNEYDIYNCVGLNGEIMKNEKSIEQYKNTYNMLDFSALKYDIQNRAFSKFRNNDETNITNKKNSDKNIILNVDKGNNINDDKYSTRTSNINKNVNYNISNFEFLMSNKKLEIKSLTKNILKMCSSGVLSFFFNKINYYCKTGIFKILNRFNKVNKNLINSPLSWYTLLYYINNIDFIRSKYLLKLTSYDEKTGTIDGLFRGFVYINNHVLGSFWVTDDKVSYENEINEDKLLKKKTKKKKTKTKTKKEKMANNENLITIPLTRYMRIPTDWLVEGINVIIIFDEFGGNPYKVAIVQEVLHGGVYSLTKKEKYVNWLLLLFILSFIVFIIFFCFKALNNYFKTKEENERNKQNYQNIIENIITHNIYVNSSYDDATEESNSEHIQNVSDFLDS